MIRMSLWTPHFNPRAPRGARPFQFSKNKDDLQFQSTGPSRSPTEGGTCKDRDQEHFNPRAPRGARRDISPDVRDVIVISIHGPLAEPDTAIRSICKAKRLFQSTGPSRSPTISSPIVSIISAFQSTGPSRSPT